MVLDIVFNLFPKVETGSTSSISNFNPIIITAVISTLGATALSYWCIYNITKRQQAAINWKNYEKETIVEYHNTLNNFTQYLFQVDSLKFINIIIAYMNMIDSRPDYLKMIDKSIEYTQTVKIDLSKKYNSFQNAYSQIYLFYHLDDKEFKERIEKLWNLIDNYNTKCEIFIGEVEAEILLPKIKINGEPPEKINTSISECLFEVRKKQKEFLENKELSQLKNSIISEKREVSTKILNKLKEIDN
jgi:hypothetical protein